MTFIACFCSSASNSEKVSNKLLSHFRLIRIVADVLLVPQGIQETQGYQASTALQGDRERKENLVRLEHLVCPAVQRCQTGNNAHGRT